MDVAETMLTVLGLLGKMLLLVLMRTLMLMLILILRAHAQADAAGAMPLRTIASKTERGFLRLPFSSAMARAEVLGSTSQLVRVWAGQGTE